jgi:hypothetical protein
MKKELLDRLKTLVEVNKRELVPEDKKDQYALGYQNGCMETLRQVKEIVEALPEEELVEV